MKQFVSILTAVCVSAHMLWGCCMHDAHASDADGTLCAITDQHGVSPGDDCDHSPTHDRSAPQRHCPDGNCSFSRSAGWQDALITLSLMPAALSVMVEVQPPAISHDCIDLETTLCPVSLHQWRQILLI